MHDVAVTLDTSLHKGVATDHPRSTETRLPTELSFGHAASPTYHRLKRVIDLVGACGLCILLFPLLLSIGALIRCDSPGSIIFRHKRVGARRRTVGSTATWEPYEFYCYKFRTMYNDADQSWHKRQVEKFVKGDMQPGTGTFKPADDPRITRVGRWLRRVSVDEVPQIINVLKGEMSLVGPRPVPLYEVLAYKSADFERLCALPGITGPWQVSGRSTLSFSDMIRLDTNYARSRSLVQDIYILCQTLPAVFSTRGAA